MNLIGSWAQFTCEVCGNFISAGARPCPPDQPRQIRTFQWLSSRMTRWDRCFAHRRAPKMRRARSQRGLTVPVLGSTR
jgi:hypothetical protein